MYPRDRIGDISHVPDFVSRLCFDRRHHGGGARNGYFELLMWPGLLAEKVGNPPIARTKQVMSTRGRSWITSHFKGSRWVDEKQEWVGMVRIYQPLVPVLPAGGLKADLIIFFTLGDVTRELHFRGTLHWTRRWSLRR